MQAVRILSLKSYDEEVDPTPPEWTPYCTYPRRQQRHTHSVHVLPKPELLVMTPQEGEAWVKDANQKPFSRWGSTQFKTDPVVLSEVYGDGAFGRLDSELVEIVGAPLCTFKTGLALKIKTLMRSQYMRVSEYFLPPRRTKLPSAKKLLGASVWSALSTCEKEYCSHFPIQTFSAILQDDDDAAERVQRYESSKQAVATSKLRLQNTLSRCEKMIEDAEAALKRAQDNLHEQNK